MTFITPELFIAEIKNWKLSDKSMYKIRMMELGNILYFKFHIPNSTEILETGMTREDYEKFAVMELSPLCVPATWENKELIVLYGLKKKLEELTALLVK